VDNNDQQKPHSVRQNMSFTTFDFLATVITENPPLYVVLTLWLSMTPAVGMALAYVSRQHTKAMLLHNA
jgi:hypothetical protein